MESCGVVHPFRVPLMIHPLRRTFDVIVTRVEKFLVSYFIVNRGRENVEKIFFHFNLIC